MELVRARCAGFASLETLYAIRVVMRGTYYVYVKEHAGWWEGLCSDMELGGLSLRNPSTRMVSGWDQHGDRVLFESAAGAQDFVRKSQGGVQFWRNSGHDLRCGFSFRPGGIIEEWFSLDGWTSEEAPEVATILKGRCDRLESAGLLVLSRFWPDRYDGEVEDSELTKVAAARPRRDV